MDDYENFFEIGAIVEVKWSNEEAALLPQGWHVGEVQSFDRDDDEIDIILTDKPDWKHTISVLPNLLSDRLRIKQNLF